MKHTQSSGGLGTFERHLSVVGGALHGRGHWIGNDPARRRRVHARY